MKNLMTMPKKIYWHIKTSVTPLDIIISKLKKKDSKKIKVGWCSTFPPAPHGIAVANYFLLNKLIGRKDLEIYAIPFGGRIDKKLFPGIKFARIGSSYLDIIIFYGLGSYLENIINKIKVKTIAWQTLHEPLPNSKCELKMLKYLKKSDLVIGFSEWSVKEYKQHGIKNAEYIPFATDTALFKQHKRRHDNFTVLYVGRVCYYKGIIPFLDSIPIILKKYPKVIFKLHGAIDVNPRTSAHLGKTSANIDEIKSAIKKIKKKYPHNFFMETKWIDYTKMNYVYHNVDVLLFPSYSEGFGIPLIEAMSNGIPCIVADKPPMNEIVINNKTGFCIKYRKSIEKKYNGIKFPHPEDIAEKVIFLIENKKKLDILRKNCRSHVKKNYEMQQCVNDIIAKIKELVKKKEGNQR